ncbi:hypothetical protein [Leucobacter sp. USHLN154]|uniref:hypothetical protein n=1 Tax=Leucobacter sp. USHLN154 TaxID=3081269 RepID=UPI003018388B
MSLLAIALSQNRADEVVVTVQSSPAGSFWETLLATIVGALFAFLGSWIVYRLSRKKADEERTQEAVVDFMKWVSQEGIPRRQAVDDFNHLKREHPEMLKEHFPGEEPKVDLLVETTEISRLVISTSGLVHDIAKVVRRAHHRDSGESIDIALVYWSSFNDLAAGVFEKIYRDKGSLQDAFRAREKKLRVIAADRHRDCVYCFIRDHGGTTHPADQN